MNAIEINKLSKSYGQLQALKEVDLSIQPGEFFGLLGKNGAGKSTLINLLAGLNKPTSGNAIILGADVVKEPNRAKQNLGVVPQEIVQDVFFNIKQLLFLQAGYYGISKKKAEPWVNDLLALLQLTQKANANMRTLSGGMKRRWMVAMALVHQPSVLVLDEPTAGVDIELRKNLWDFVTALHQKGRTVVLTTHYLQEAEKLCDRIGILHQGQLVALEKKQTLLARHPFRMLNLTFETAPPFCPEQIKIFVHKILNDEKTWILRLHRQKDSVQDILLALSEAHFKVSDLFIVEPTLEEVFLSITGKSI